MHVDKDAGSTSDTISAYDQSSSSDTASSLNLSVDEDDTIVAKRVDTINGGTGGKQRRDLLGTSSIITGFSLIQGLLYPGPPVQSMHTQIGYSLGRSTVSDILKKRATYLQSWEENQSRKWRRLSKETDLSQMNQFVYDFFRQARAKSIPITGGLLKAKAADYASSLRIEGFKASNGWLGSWKGRYNVKQFKQCGEGTDVDEEVVDKYKT